MVKLDLPIVELNLIRSLFQLPLTQHQQVMCTGCQRMGTFLSLELVTYYSSLTQLNADLIQNSEFWIPVKV